MNRNPEDSGSGPRVNAWVMIDFMQNSKLCSVVDGYDDIYRTIPWENAMVQLHNLLDEDRQQLVKWMSCDQSSMRRYGVGSVIQENGDWESLFHNCKL
eukprot:scaffold970_cov65-Cylindrotheca_fusiformis.AAC.1